MQIVHAPKKKERKKSVPLSCDLQYLSITNILLYSVGSQ